jgi:diadenosine tetraphosphate (Ap4A) HIT family hydrolase
VVSHIVTPDALGREGTAAYLGHLLVEPLRHAPGLADLTDAEARSVGWWSTQASRALREVAGAEHARAYLTVAWQAGSVRPSESA